MLLAHAQPDGKALVDFRARTDDHEGASFLWASPAAKFRCFGRNNPQTGDTPKE
jgi:hypothetical protein